MEHSDILGKTVMIIDPSDFNYKKKGKIIDILNAYFSLVIEFEDGKTNLYHSNEITLDF